MSQNNEYGPNAAEFYDDEMLINLFKLMDDYIDKLKVSNEDRKKIEKITMNQSQDIV